jgi:hypothetical protein
MVTAGEERRMTAEQRRERPPAGPSGAEGEGQPAGAEEADAGQTPQANREATAQHEAEGEGYRRRGRRAMTGQTAPLKDMAQAAPEGHAGQE